MRTDHDARLEEARQEAWRSEDGHESVPPPTEVHKGVSGNSNCSTDEVYVFDVPKEGSTDAFEFTKETDVSFHTAAAPLFPGFEETSFSTPEKRYYKPDGQKVWTSGAYGVVKQVQWYNPGTGELEPCVSKSLTMDVATMDSGAISRWQAEGLREVNALRRMAGVPGVVRYRDMIEESGAIHIIMEEVNGITMTMRVMHRDWDLLGLTWLQLRLALKQLAQVLAECHRQGLVHSDVKPENIMSLVDKSGIVLIDFGSASMCDDGGSWKYEGGTTLYAPPELIRHKRSKSTGDALPWSRFFGPPADCWAYGITAFKLLTGCLLFSSATDATNPDESLGTGDWERRRIRRNHARSMLPSERRRSSSREHPRSSGGRGSTSCALSCSRTQPSG